MHNMYQHIGPGQCIWHETQNKTLLSWLETVQWSGNRLPYIPEKTGTKNQEVVDVDEGKRCLQTVSGVFIIFSSFFHHFFIICPFLWSWNVGSPGIPATSVDIASTGLPLELRVMPQWCHVWKVPWHLKVRLKVRTFRCTFRRTFRCPWNLFRCRVTS
jgi:hypothetical protein